MFVWWCQILLLIFETVFDNDTLVKRKKKIIQLDDYIVLC